MVNDKQIVTASKQIYACKCFFTGLTVTAGASAAAEVKIYDALTATGDYTSYKAPAGTSITLGIYHPVRYSTGMYVAISGADAIAEIYVTNKDTR